LFAEEPRDAVTIQQQEPESAIGVDRPEATVDQPPSAEPNSAESNIAQTDGLYCLDNWDTDSDSDDELCQLDGSSNGPRAGFEPVPKPAFKVLDSANFSSVHFVVSTAEPVESDANSTPSVSGTSARPVSESAVPPSAVAAAIRQPKRERSDSYESSDGGDPPTKRTHQCHFCNKLFANAFRLKIHVRVHTGEKPFKCEPCNQAFSDRSNFVKHKQTKTHKNKAAKEEEGNGNTLSVQATRLQEMGESHGQPQRSLSSGGVAGHPALVRISSYCFIICEK
jgi:uncharacterized C2H2 Zn-finger protein